MVPMRDRDDEELWATGAEEGEGGFEIPPFLLDPVGVLRRRWMWMLAAALLGLAATTVLVATWDPIYTARATVLFTGQSVSESFVRSPVEEDQFAYVSNLINQAFSIDKLSRLVEQHDPYPNARHRSVDELAKAMSYAIEIGPARNQPSSRRSSSRVYQVSFRGRDPQTVAAVANSLAELVIEAGTTRRRDQAQQTTEFLRQALARDEAELSEHSRKLNDFRRAHQGTLPAERDTNLRKLELASERLRSLNDQILVVQNQLSGLRSSPEALPLTDNQALLDELRRELARELALHTEEHPNVVSLQQRVARLEELVASESRSPTGEAQRAIGEKRFELQRLRNQVSDVEAQVRELEARIDRTPAVSEELVALEQRQGLLQRKYLESLNKVEEAELAESLESAQQGAQVSIIGHASPPSEPAVPRWFVLAGGLAATLGLALGVAVLLELLDSVVLNTGQLEKIADRPALGTLPKVAQPS